MDADVTAHVVDALNLRGRISAASLQLNDADPSAPVAESGNIDFSRGGIARLLAKVKQQGADTLLVVGQGTAQTIAGPRTRYLPGFGLTHTNDIFQCAYVLFTMEICRVDTGARIARRVEEPCFQARKKFAVRASSDQYSAEERAELESALKEEARGRIYLAMDALKLMKDSPP